MPETLPELLTMNFWLRGPDVGGLPYYAGLYLEAGTTIGDGVVKMALDDFTVSELPLPIAFAPNVVHRLEVRFTPSAPPPSTIGTYTLYVDGVAFGLTLPLDVANFMGLAPTMYATASEGQIVVYVLRFGMHALS
jgi:hypothetical protein